MPVSQKPLQRLARYLLVVSMLFTWMLKSGVAAGAPAHHGPMHPGAPVGPARPPRPHRDAPAIVLLPPYAVQAIAGSHVHPAAPTRGPRRVAPGLLPTPRGRLCRSSQVARRYIQARRRSSLPAAVDLSRYDPPVADEGQVRAGAAWATAYMLVGWWARKYRLMD